MWYYKHQKAFKLWKTGHSMTGDCSLQTITDDLIKETWLLMDRADRIPQVYELFGTKSGICEVRSQDGDVLQSLSVS